MPEKIRRRKDWGAAPSGPTTPQSATPEGFVHYTGDHAPDRMSSGDVVAAMRRIQAFHQGPQRGWSDIGYHAVIFPTAVPGWRILEGRPLDRVPAAQLGHNTGTAACAVYIGPGQLITRATRYLVETWYRQSGARIRTLGWHGQVTATDCPGHELKQAVPVMARALGVELYNPGR